MVKFSRTQGLGASDISAAIGLDPYRKPLDVWMEKRGLAEPFAGNEHTRWGNRIEPVLREALAEEVGTFGPAVPANTTMIMESFGAARIADLRTDQRQVTVYHPSLRTIWATPDELYYDGRLVAGGEVKNKGARVAHRWGESGTDEVPDEVLVQCLVGMRCCELEDWYVGAYFGGADYRVYRLRYDHAVAEQVIDQALGFWHDYVLPGKMPAVTGGEDVARALAKLFPAPDETVDDATPEEAEAIWALIEARAARDTADAIKSEIENRVRAMIGNRKGLACAAGKVTWSRVKDSIRTDDAAVVADLAKQYPEAVDLAVRAHTSARPGGRRLLVTPAKTVKVAA